MSSPLIYLMIKEECKGVGTLLICDSFVFSYFLFVGPFAFPG